MQTIYSFSRPIYFGSPPQPVRKIYFLFSKEINKAPIVQPDRHWAGNLNPHVIASRGEPEKEEHPNPYTRFTLIAIARCLIAYADSEFATDTSESVALARSLYLQARDVLSSSDLDHIPPTDPKQSLLPNPVIEALWRRIDLALVKIRSGRNIAGMRRQLELLAAPPAEDGIIALPAAVVLPQVLRPTPYRYSVLVERSRQLVAVAQQMEAAYLSALQQRDIEDEKLLREGFAFDLGEATVELQKRRETEAKDNKGLAELQKVRSEKVRDRYDDWLKAGPTESEKIQIKELWTANTFRNLSYTSDAAASVASFLEPKGIDILTKSFAGPAYVLAVGASATLKGLAGGAETMAQVAGINASYERREQEWTLQRDLANADIEINKQQSQIATDQENIVKQERIIAEMQRDQAAKMKAFLINKFLSSEFYDWIRTRPASGDQCLKERVK